ncbi:DHS-like NAD/FAD-binding domain-containing protein, partial [Coniochaeta sp. 2T2.1]
KVIVIAGAGISTSIGIPAFRNCNSSAYSSFGKELFHYSALRSPETRCKLYTMIDDLLRKIEIAKPTPFHHMMGRLASSGQLLRLYTQNVDAIDTDMPSLQAKIGGANKWPIAIALHGRLDKLICEVCRNEQPFKRSLFQNETVTAQCPGCQKHPITTRSGRKSAPGGPSLLRPRMLFYDDPLDLDDTGIEDVSRFDVAQKVDTVLVVGTSLSKDVRGTRDLVHRLCGFRQGSPRHTIWINPQLPPKDL